MISPNVLTSALSGLTTNAQRISRAADNIVNVSTTGYKAGDVRSVTLVTRQTLGSGYAAGGGVAISQPGNNIQGLLQSTASATDLAISGDGFFAVAPDASGKPVSYTRSGSFKPNSEGFLVNAQGRYLLGHPVDAHGLTDIRTLGAININRVAGTADATDAVALSANLPSLAAVGDDFAVTANVTDSLGNALSLELTFTKSGTNRYTLTAGDVTNSGGSVGTVVEGTDTGPAYAVDVVFNGDGTLAGFDADQDGAVDSATPPNLVVANPTTGAEDLDIVLNVTGSAGGSGLTQYGSNFTLGYLSSGGARYGHLTGVDVSEGGTITARFSNGESRAIADIPVVTFTNPDGLQAFSGNAYGATDASGDPLFGAAGAGTVQGGALELSTTDLATEIVNLILAETAYKASAKLISTADELSDTLLDTVG